MHSTAVVEPHDAREEHLLDQFIREGACIATELAS